MAYAASVGAGLDESQLAQIRRRAILACAIGNFFELFDFTIYGFFAVAISRAFYPSGSMYGTFAAFGAAFLMRPVGAIVLGAYGDRMGRRAALVVTIGLMAVATGLTGLIPTYQSIGIWAPIALIVCRLLQGFSTGGEWGGAAAFLVEYAPPGRRRPAGGWRIPFIAGFLLGPIGYYLRRKVAETPVFARAVESRKVERSPLRVAFRD